MPQLVQLELKPTGHGFQWAFPPPPQDGTFELAKRRHQRRRQVRPLRVPQGQWQF